MTGFYCNRLAYRMKYSVLVMHIPNFSIEFDKALDWFDDRQEKQMVRDYLSHRIQRENLRSVICFNDYFGGAMNLRRQTWNAVKWLEFFWTIKCFFSISSMQAIISFTWIHKLSCRIFTRLSKSHELDEKHSNSNHFSLPTISNVYWIQHTWSFDSQSACMWNNLIGFFFQHGCVLAPQFENNLAHVFECAIWIACKKFFIFLLLFFRCHFFHLQNVISVNCRGSDMSRQIAYSALNTMSIRAYLKHALYCSE